jgi:hypothetical protein
LARRHGQQLQLPGTDFTPTPGRSTSVARLWWLWRRLRRQHCDTLRLDAAELQQAVEQGL